MNVSPNLERDDETGAAEMLDARVVLLTHYIPLYQLPIYQELSRRIRDFHVLISTEIEPNRHFQPQWEDLDVRVQKTFTLNRNWKHSAGFDDTLYVHFPRDTRSQLKKLRPDVVLSLELGFRSLACAWHRILDRKSRLVLCTFMSEHTEQGRGTGRAMLRRWLTRRADAFTFNGPSCRKVLNKLGVRNEQMFHFPYAANPNNIYTGPIKRDADSDRRLLCVGQISQRKGVAPMIDQLDAYARENPGRQIHVTLAGEGPLKQDLEEQRSQHPTNLTIDLLGNVPAGELPQLMQTHGVMLFPTLADEWGLVVNEAMHAGMPVIGSMLAQASNTLIEPGKNGWTYDPREITGAGSLASVLDSLFATDHDSLHQMRVAARETVSDITPKRAADGAIDACRFVMNKDSHG